MGLSDEINSRFGDVDASGDLAGPTVDAKKLAVDSVFDPDARISECDGRGRFCSRPEDEQEKKWRQNNDCGCCTGAAKPYNLTSLHASIATDSDRRAQDHPLW